MNKKRDARIRFFSWLVVAVVLTLILIMGISNFAFHDTSISCGGFGMGYTYPNADKYKKGDFTLEEEISQLKINWTAGSVSVKVTDGDKVYAEETNVSDDDRKMRYLVEDGKLTIQFQKSKWFSLRDSFSKGKDLTVYIPEKMAENMRMIDIETTSADLEISGFNSRTVDIETVSGEVNIKDVSAEFMDIEGVSGTIKGTAVKADELKAEVVSGSVDMDGIFQIVDLEAVSGDLNISSDTFIKEADAETVSGRISLSIPEGDGFTAELDSVSGDFNTDFDIKSKDSKKIYGDGSAKYSFETVSGNVYINRTE